MNTDYGSLTTYICHPAKKIMPAKDPSDPDKDRHFVTALSRGLKILSCFSHRQPELKMLKRNDPATWPATERNIHQAFDEYREHGFVLSIGFMHEHFNAVAVPIRSVNGGAVHGLSASGLASIWTRETLMEIGSKLAALARDLSTVPASTSN